MPNSKLSPTMDITSVMRWPTIHSSAVHQPVIVETFWTDQVIFLRVPESLLQRFGAAALEALLHTSGIYAECEDILYRIAAAWLQIWEGWRSSELPETCQLTELDIHHNRLHSSVMRELVTSPLVENGRNS